MNKTQTKATYAIKWYYVGGGIDWVSTKHYGTHDEAKAYAEANKGKAVRYTIRKVYYKHETNRI